MKQTLRVVEWVLAGVFAVAVAALVMAPYVQTQINEWWPVKTDWRVTSARVEGTDLLLSGTFVKHFDCEYMPPPGATNVLTGAPVFVESSSAGRGMSYPARKEPYKFGPWRVVDGAGMLLEFYHRDRCHVGWKTFTRLGKFDGRTMEQVQ